MRLPLSTSLSDGLRSSNPVPDRYQPQNLTGSFASNYLRDGKRAGEADSDLPAPVPDCAERRIDGTYLNIARNFSVMPPAHWLYNQDRYYFKRCAMCLAI